MERMAGSDAAEVARARAGDDGAFRTLVERHGRAVFRLAYRMTGNTHDAEDVVQEAFLKVHRQLHRFEDRSAFSSWLHRIASNCAYDVLRRRARRRDQPLAATPDEPSPLETIPSDAPAPDRAVHAGEITERVGAAMARLSAQERAAFALRHYEGRSMREIGELLGLEEQAAKHSVFRAVRKLRAALAPLVAEGSVR